MIVWVYAAAVGIHNLYAYFKEMWVFLFMKHTNLLEVNMYTDCGTIVVDSKG